MNSQAAVLETASIQQQCKVLRLPAIAAQCGPTRRTGGARTSFAPGLPRSAAASRTRRTGTAAGGAAHSRSASATDEDPGGVRLRPQSQISAQQIHELAQGAYIGRAEPVIFIGDSGTGKTHLLTGLAVAACRQKRRVRFTTAAALINEMVEAKHQLQLGRALEPLGPLRPDRAR